MTRLAAMTFALLTCAAMPALAQRSGHDAVPRSDRPPERLVDVGRGAVAVFDAARTGNWPEAGTRLKAIRDAMQTLPRRLPDATLQRQLRTRLHALDLNIRDRRQLPAMRDANDASRVVAELASKYAGSPPAGVALLSYYGRELEIGSFGQRPAVIRRAVADIHTAWREVEPLLIQRGSSDEARRFTDIVVQLDGARKPSQVATAATAELAEADRVAQALGVPR